MTTPIHFLVKGTPVSFRSKREVVLNWRRKVAAAARSCVPRPTLHGELSVSITHFYRSWPRCDADNMSKPICDALSNVVYRDDRQIMECTCRRIPLSRAFSLSGMPRELAVALCEGAEFVFIRITQTRPDLRSVFFHRASRLWQ